MDKTFKVFESKTKYAIYFETVAMQQKRPSDVFTASVYQQHKGGYVYVEGQKYEYNMGVIKVLCDGQLLVYIDEVEKQLIVDSLRDQDAEAQQLVFNNMLEKEHGDFNYQYLKVDTLKGKPYHQIKCTLSKNKDVHMLYWIDTKTEQMYMYAEYNEGLYNVYLIKKYGTPPAKHNYSIFLPKTEIKTFHGYEVLDQRFLPKVDPQRLEQRLKALEKR